MNFLFLPQGIPENEAKGFVGTHWTLKVGFNDKKVWWQMECEEFPALNMFVAGIEEGKEFTTPDKGFGKSVVVSNSIPGQGNVLHVVSKTERYGTIETIETYSETGLKIVRNSRQHCTLQNI